MHKRPVPARIPSSVAGSVSRRYHPPYTMKGKSQTVEESTRIEAYLLSEKAGHPSGMDAYFWEQAQAIVQARKTAVAGAVKKAAAKKPTAAKFKGKAAPKAKPAIVKKSRPKAAAKNAQFSLDGSAAAPARKRPAKK